MRSRFIGLVLVCAATAFAALAPLANATGIGPPLTGEVFGGFAPGQHFLTITAKQCNPQGISSFSFNSFGSAAGPYPGTYDESGTVSFGPITEPSPFIEFGFDAGTVLDAQASFSIDSPVGQVLGTKTLDKMLVDVGSCADLDQALIVLGIPVGTVPCENVHFVQADLKGLHYEATITNATGSFADSGDAPSMVRDLRARCLIFGVPTEVFGGAFDEAFASSAPLNTPGEATGGGMLAAVAGPGVTLGFNARSTGDSFKGICTVIFHSPPPGSGSMVKCLDVTAFLQIGNQVTFSGPADVNGTRTTYQIDVVDNGEPGTADTFAILTGNGFAAAGTLMGGDIQVH